MADRCRRRLSARNIQAFNVLSVKLTDERYSYVKSICFLVAQYRACPRHGGVGGHREELWLKVGRGAAFQVEGAHGLDVVAQGVGVCQGLRPARHAGYRREQAAHKDEDYEEEEHQQGGLLHGGGAV